MTRAFNRDCMEAMREFPDKFFDLAVVDPPYGGGSSQTVKVERERERERESLSVGAETGKAVKGVVSEGGLTSTISAARTGGGWFAKVRQRRRGRTSEIGMSRPGKTIFTSLRE